MKLNDETYQKIHELIDIYTDNGVKNSSLVLIQIGIALFDCYNIADYGKPNPNIIVDENITEQRFRTAINLFEDSGAKEPEALTELTIIAITGKAYLNGAEIFNLEYNKDRAAEVIAEIVTDPNISTYETLGDLISVYNSAETDNERDIINRVVEIFTESTLYDIFIKCCFYR